MSNLSSICITCFDMFYSITYYASVSSRITGSSIYCLLFGVGFLKNGDTSYFALCFFSVYATLGKKHDFNMMIGGSRNALALLK